MRGGHTFSRAWTRLVIDSRFVIDSRLVIDSRFECSWLPGADPYGFSKRVLNPIFNSIVTIPSSSFT